MLKLIPLSRKRYQFCVRYTKIYKICQLYRGIFFIFYDISQPNIAVLLTLDDLWRCCNQLYHSEILISFLYYAISPFTLHNAWLYDHYRSTQCWEQSIGCLQYCWGETWSNYCEKCVLPLWSSYTTRLQIHLFSLWRPYTIYFFALISTVCINFCRWFYHNSTIYVFFSN